jgi:hypothetical protein
MTELGDRREARPVGHAFRPDEALSVQIAAVEVAFDLSRAQRANLLPVDDDMPNGIGVGLLGWGSGLVCHRGHWPLLIDARLGVSAQGILIAPAHHDDVRAFLAADLKGLVADLVVADLVLGAAVVADDLHPSAPSRQKAPRRFAVARAIIGSGSSAPQEPEGERLCRCTDRPPTRLDTTRSGHQGSLEGSDVLRQHPQRLSDAAGSCHQADGWASNATRAFGSTHFQ